MTNAPTLKKISLMPPLKRRADAVISHEFKLPVWLTLAHLPLGIVLYNAGSLALIHPFAVFLLGIRAACDRKMPLERVAPYIAYLVGAEVLWRMAHLPIFWESGKYASALIMVVALARRGKWKIPTLPLLFILFLIPACLLTAFYEPDISKTREMLSFGMSGPLLLFAACWFFSYLKVSTAQLKTILFSLIVPLSSVAVTTLFYTLTTADIVFNTESNNATSGGFGPNQVSATLGLGAFLCITGYLIFKNKLFEALFLSFFTILFAAQSVMTFSRGGMYNALGAAAAVAFFRLLDPAEGIKKILPLALVALIFLLIVFPYLNDFTGGNLQARYEETELTNRGSIIEADMEIFWAHPLFGVGVGQSFFEYQKILEQGTASHTEFSRLLSEHGFFGVLAMLCLVCTFAENLLRQRSSVGRALVAGMVLWGSLFMLNAGMRLAAPSFIIGLSCLTLTSAGNVSKKSEFRRLARTKR